jgi:hypothetical protein
MRSQDTAYGALLAAVSRHHAFGMLPFAVFHDRLEKRKLRLSDCKRRLTYLTGAELITALLYRFTKAASGSKNPLQYLGNSLENLANLKKSDFRAAVQEVAVESLKYRLDSIDRFANNFRISPSYLRRELREIRKRTIMSMDDVHYSPADLDRDCSRSAVLLQKIVALYGRSLIDWKLILKASRRRFP